MMIKTVPSMELSISWLDNILFPGCREDPAICAATARIPLKPLCSFLSLPGGANHLHTPETFTLYREQSLGQTCKPVSK